MLGVTPGALRQRVRSGDLRAERGRDGRRDSRAPMFFRLSELERARAEEEQRPRERFLALVKRERRTGCWRWLGASYSAKNREGRGAFSLGGRAQLAHRAAFLLFRGPLSREDAVVRTCGPAGFRFCVNPEHLAVVPDARSANRFRGERHPGTSLDEAGVREIRRRFEKGELLRDIARDFRITPRAVSAIARGRNWGHVPGACEPRRRAGTPPRRRSRRGP